MEVNVKAIFKILMLVISFGAVQAAATNQPIMRRSQIDVGTEIPFFVDLRDVAELENNEFARAVIQAMQRAPHRFFPKNVLFSIKGVSLPDCKNDSICTNRVYGVEATGPSGRYAVPDSASRSQTRRFMWHAFPGRII